MDSPSNKDSKGTTPELEVVTDLPANAASDHETSSSKNDVLCAVCTKNDGRPLGHWASTYTDCIGYIISECVYIAALLMGSAILLFFAWEGSIGEWLGIGSRYSTLLPYIYAFLAGLIGGTLFTLKWLYHSLARKLWHLDRLTWRIFTPWMSAFFATIMYVMMTSGLISAFDGAALTSGKTAFSMGFLVGYFSDSAMSKFREIANTIFGTSTSS